MPKQKKGKLIGLGLPANLLKEFIDLSYKGNTSIAPEGYDIDAPLSDSRVKVYQKKGSNQFIIVHRGSVGLQDWVDNAKFFVAGNVKNTKSFKLHQERQKKAVEKYGGENMIGIGHSRAGLYLQQLQKDPETKLKEIITYNKAVGFYDALRTNPDEQTDVKVKNDFVSLLSGLQKRKNKMVEIDATKNPLDFNKAHQAAEIDKLGDTFIGKKEEEKLEGSGRAPSTKSLEELRKKLKTLEKQLINIEQGKVYKTTNKEKVSYEISYTKRRIANYETKGEDLIETKKKVKEPKAKKEVKPEPKKEEPKPEPKKEEPEPEKKTSTDNKKKKKLSPKMEAFRKRQESFRLMFRTIDAGNDFERKKIVKKLYDELIPEEKKTEWSNKKLIEYVNHIALWDAVGNNISYTKQITREVYDIFLLSDIVDEFNKKFKEYVEKEEPKPEPKKEEPKPEPKKITPRMEKFRKEAEPSRLMRKTIDEINKGDDFNLKNIVKKLYDELVSADRKKDERFNQLITDYVNHTTKNAPKKVKEALSFNIFDIISGFSGTNVNEFNKRFKEYVEKEEVKPPKLEKQKAFLVEEPKKEEPKKSKYKYITIINELDTPNFVTALTQSKELKSWLNKLTEKLTKNDRRINRATLFFTPESKEFLNELFEYYNEDKKISPKVAINFVDEAINDLIEHLNFNDSVTDLGMYQKSLNTKNATLLANAMKKYDDSSKNFKEEPKPEPKKEEPKKEVTSPKLAKIEEFITDTENYLNKKSTRAFNALMKKYNDKDFIKAILGAQKFNDFYPTSQKCLSNYSEYLNNNFYEDEVILEPTAGLGSIVLWLLKNNVKSKIIATDYNKDINKYLKESFDGINQVTVLDHSKSDYLDMKNEYYKYNPSYIFLNPPFSNGNDKKYYLNFLYKAIYDLQKSKHRIRERLLFFISPQLTNKNEKNDDVVYDISISKKKKEEIKKMLNIDEDEWENIQPSQILRVNVCTDFGGTKMEAVLYVIITYGDTEIKKGGYFWESKEVKEEKKAKKIAEREAFEREKQERRKVRREAVDSFVKKLNEAKKNKKQKGETAPKAEDDTQMAMEEEPQLAIEGGIFGFSAEEKARKQAYKEKKAAYAKEHKGSTADYVFSKSVREKFDKEYEAKKNKAQQGETAPKAIESAQQGVEEGEPAIEGGKLTKEGLAQLSKKELHALNKKFSKAFRGQFSKKHKKKGGGIEMFGKMLWSGLSNAPEEIRIQQEAGKVLNGVKVWHLPFWKPADHITEQQAREMVEARAKELGIEALRDKMSKEVGFDVRQMDNNKALGLAFSSALDGLSYTPLGVGASVASSVASQVLDPNLKPLEEKEEEKEGGGFYYLKEIAEPTNPIFKYKHTYEIPTFIDPETEFLLLGGT